MKPAPARSEATSGRGPQGRGSPPGPWPGTRGQVPPAAEFGPAAVDAAAPAVLVDINAPPGLDHVVTWDRRGPGRARSRGTRRRPGRRRVQPLVAMRWRTWPTRRSATGHHRRLARARRRRPRCRWCLAAARGRRRRGAAGRRTIAADDLYVGPPGVAPHHDEIAVSAFFPAPPPAAGVAFEEIARRHGDYAMCGVAAVVVDGR